MNILYYTTDKLHSTKGGTERTTITVATALTRLYGCRCFSVYERPADTSKEDCIVEEFLWNQREYTAIGNTAFLRDIIQKESINCVVVQGAFIHVARFREAIGNLDCRLIFAHHFQPRCELEFFRFKNIWTGRGCGLINTLRWARNILFYPLLRKRYRKSLSKVYKEAYDLADSVVLLSREFISSYKEFGNFSCEEKFRIIPNALSFELFGSSEDIERKKPIVLIVARLDEKQKKISQALRIWQEIKHHPEAKEWTLKIVGDGQDRNMLERIILNEKIPDVVMLGRCDPAQYYLEASIFMMTSKSESWGLTLTEAQQFGAVPIAFNTYQSLQDIITDGEDGLIIPPGNKQAYTDAVIDLMRSPVKRKQIAQKAISSCRRYQPDNIVRFWWKLLNSEKPKA